MHPDAFWTLINAIMTFLPSRVPMTRWFSIDLQWFEQNYAGVMPFEVLIDCQKPGQIIKSHNLARIEKFQKALQDYPEFSRSLSIVDATKLYWIKKDEEKLPNTENNRVYYTDIEHAEGYNDADFFNATVLNGVPQKQNGPAFSQVNELKENS